MKVFWSWQSDVAPKENRWFIRDALIDAIKLAASELAVTEAERPEIDQDTLGAAGMVDIAATILGKIVESAVFVADVTPIGKTDKGKALPNPNVMVELGWAMNKPGISRIIAVLNAADGWKVEELPFDIRHRSVMKYALKPGADAVERARVRKQLTAELAAALKVNLGAELVERAAATPVIGVDARPEERSIWAHAVQDIPFHEGLGAGLPRKVVVPHGPRGYARFIPAAWTNAPPSVAAVEAWSEFAKLPPMEGGSAGSFGPSEDGYVRFWGASLNGGDYQASNVAMFFEKTGELWILHGTAIDPGGDRTYLRVGALLKHWSTALRTADRFFDEFGAYPVRKIEFGVTQMRDARWLVGSSTLALPISRKPGVVVERQERDWTNAAQIAFLRVAYNELRNAFSLAPEDEASFGKTLQQLDPERFQ